MWTKGERRLLWILGVVLLLIPLCVDAGEKIVNEPVLTYNLFITIFLVPLCVTLLGAWQSRKMDRYYAGWDAYNKLREETLNKWKEDTAKALCGIKESVDNVEKAVGNAVTTKHCEGAMTEAWEGINHHGHRGLSGEDGDVVRKSK